METQKQPFNLAFPTLTYILFWSMEGVKNINHGLGFGKTMEPFSRFLFATEALVVFMFHPPRHLSSCVLLCTCRVCAPFSSALWLGTCYTKYGSYWHACAATVQNQSEQTQYILRWKDLKSLASHMNCAELCGSLKRPKFYLYIFLHKWKIPRD